MPAKGDKSSRNTKTCPNTKSEHQVNQKSSNKVASKGGLLNQSHIFSTEVTNSWNIFLDVRL